MLVGVPKEIKNQESRVGLTPASVKELVLRGHQVLVQKNAGAAIGLTDAMYEASGASIVEAASEIFARAEMIVKVKEPQPQECAMLRKDQILYTYLHLAPDPEAHIARRERGAEHNDRTGEQHMRGHDFLQKYETPQHSEHRDEIHGGTGLRGANACDQLKVEDISDAGANHAERNDAQPGMQ